MKTLNTARFVGLALCVASVCLAASADAQAIRHDKMDARAARRDIARLQKDRARAVHYKNWSKVAQDDRLIASDRFWVTRDHHKVENSGGK